MGGPPLKDQADVCRWSLAWAEAARVTSAPHVPERDPVDERIGDGPSLTCTLNSPVRSHQNQTSTPIAAASLARNTSIPFLTKLSSDASTATPTSFARSSTGCGSSPSHRCRRRSIGARFDRARFLLRRSPAAYPGSRDAKRVASASEQLARALLDFRRRRHVPPLSCPRRTAQLRSTRGSPHRSGRGT
jgi:hypothetical protein